MRVSTADCGGGGGVGRETLRDSACDFILIIMASRIIIMIMITIIDAGSDCGQND